MELGDPPRLPSPDHSEDDRAAKLNHGGNAGSFLNTATCDYLQEASRQRWKYHDWAEHPKPSTQNYSIFEHQSHPESSCFCVVLFQGVCEVKEDTIHWPPDLSQKPAESHFLWRKSVVGTASGSNRRVYLCMSA